jgi:L-cystine uptake protein TcyP (sodium:dicarboxylate symporter family)
MRKWLTYKNIISLIFVLFCIFEMYRNWSDISTLFWIACSLGLFIGCTLLISESDRQDEEYSQLLEEYLYFCDENFKQFLELEKTNKLKSK